jgi:hypothetical protein
MRQNAFFARAAEGALVLELDRSLRPFVRAK